MQENYLTTSSEFFEGYQIRRIWNSRTSDYNYSIQDVIDILDEDNKKAISKENKLTMSEMIDSNGALRLIDFLPGTKKEQFKLWINSFKENYNQSQDKYNKHLKLNKEHHYNLIISDKNENDKFLEFEDSKLFESKTLLYEIERPPKMYRKYFRGEIVKVKFGVNLGSEFSGEHFAIVLSKDDSVFSPILHVIPLTSKKHPSTINVGNILYSEEEINILKDKLQNVSKYNKDEINKIKRTIKYYEKRKDIISYAVISQIKTVSKLSVDKNPFNEYDYLSKISCSNDLLNKIDRSIMKEYTELVTKDIEEQNMNEENVEDKYFHQLCE